MLKENKREDFPKYNKKETYGYDEVRAMLEAAMEDRARYLAYFYKVMPRELFDLYAKKALYAYGEFKANGLGFGQDKIGKPEALSEFMTGTNGVASTLAVGIEEIAKDDESVTVRMEGKCALVQGWERMGLSPEEVDYLCAIACYGDYGHANALGLTGTWLARSATPGVDYCDFKATKMIEKMEV